MNYDVAFSDLDHRDENFTILDPLGEEEHKMEERWSLFYEEDLVEFLQQIPICGMFKYILKVTK